MPPPRPWEAIACWAYSNSRARSASAWRAWRAETSSMGPSSSNSSSSKGISASLSGEPAGRSSSLRCALVSCLACLSSSCGRENSLSSKACASVGIQHRLISRRASRLVRISSRIQARVSGSEGSSISFLAAYWSVNRSSSHSTKVSRAWLWGLPERRARERA